MDIVPILAAVDSSTDGIVWHPDKWDALIILCSALGGLAFYVWDTRKRARR